MVSWSWRTGRPENFHLFWNDQVVPPLIGWLGIWTFPPGGICEFVQGKISSSSSRTLLDLRILPKWPTKMAKNACCTTNQILICLPKKHKVMEDELKMYSEETDRRYTISKLVYNFSWTPLLFRWRLLRPHPAAYNPLIGACKRGLAWYSCLAYLRLMSRDETFLQSFFTSMEGEVFSTLAKSISNFRCVGGNTTPISGDLKVSLEHVSTRVT